MILPHLLKLSCGRNVAPDLRFVERVANPPVFADVDPQRALKVLVYQAPELAATA